MLFVQTLEALVVVPNLLGRELFPLEKKKKKKKNEIGKKIKINKHEILMVFVLA